MTLEQRTEQHIQSGWLAYCAEARDVGQDVPAARSEKTDDKRNLNEGRSLANRD